MIDSGLWYVLAPFILTVLIMSIFISFPFGVYSANHRMS